MSKERELLFGVFAVQTGLASARAVMEAAGAWATDRSRSLPDRLEDAGRISTAQRALLEQMVATAIEAHGGDASQTLDAVREPSGLAQSICDSIVLDSAPSQPPHPAEDPTPDAEPDPLAVTREHPGRYKLRQGEEVGRGGIGRVLLAIDEHLGREVAVKELLAERGGDLPVSTFASGRSLPAAVLRFLREARVTGQLEHPNIVPVYELGRRSDGTLYYTMKIVRGQTLAQSLKAAKGVGERLRLLPHFVDLCQAVAYAHSRGVVHRDIKPENVMLGEFGETVVLDWGLAKVRGQDDIRGEELARGIRDIHEAEDSACHTQAGTALGTPAYMSPEQAEGKLEGIDERSDIWSLGAVLYEILTGQPAYSGATAYEVIGKVMRREPEPVLEVCPRAPADLASVCAKAMQREPSERYGGAGQLAAEIVAFQTGGLVKAYDYRLGELFGRFASRHKALIAGIVLALLAVAGALVATSLAYRSEASARLDAEQAQRKEHHERLTAHYRLAQAHAEKAARLGAEARYLSAAVHAAASLEHNPLVPKSPYHTPNFDPGDSRSALLAPDTSSWLRQARIATVPGLAASVRAPEAIRTLRASPEGDWLAVLCEDHVIRIQAAGDLSVLTSIPVDNALTTEISTAGDLLAVLEAGKPIRLLRPPDAQTVSRLPTVATEGVHMALSPAGDKLVTSGPDPALRLWDVAAGNEIARIGTGERPLGKLVFSSDGQQVAGGDENGRVAVWDLKRRDLRTLPGFKRRISQVAFSADGQRIAAVGMTDALRVWETDTTRLAWRANTGHMWIGSLATSPDGRLLATGGLDASIKLWDPRTGELLQTLDGHRDEVIAVAFSADSRRLYSGSVDRTLRSWRVPPRGGAIRLVGHTKVAYGLAFDPDGRHMATGDVDGNLWLWEKKSAQVIRKLAGHKDAIQCLDYSPDGALLASSSSDGNVALWNTRTGERVAVLTGHEKMVLVAFFSPDGRWLASASHDKTLRIWEVATRAQVKVLSGHRARVTSLAFSADSRRLVSVSQDGHAVVWDRATGREVGRLDAHGDWLTGVDWSPDGRLIATASKDAQVTLWDAASLKRLHNCEGHQQWINTILFTPDGRYLITGSDDRTARAWDPETGRLVWTHLARSNLAATPSPAGDEVAIQGGLSMYLVPFGPAALTAKPEDLRVQAQQRAGLELDGFSLQPPD